MKHNTRNTIKRALALFLALQLALPQITLAEEPADVGIALEDTLSDAAGSDLESGDLESGDAFMEFSDPVTDLSSGDLSQGDAGQPAQDSVVIWRFIVGDIVSADQEAREGDLILRPDDPAAPEGQVFDGWELEDGTRLFTDADDDGVIDPVVAHPDPLYPEVNVYARFVEAVSAEEPAAEGLVVGEQPAGELETADEGQAEQPAGELQSADEGQGEQPAGEPQTTDEGQAEQPLDELQPADGEEQPADGASAEEADEELEEQPADGASAEEADEELAEQPADGASAEEADEGQAQQPAEGEVSENETESEGEEPGGDETAPAAFDQTRVVNGVMITVKAGAGVFPADADLSVKWVPVYRQLQADAAIEEVRGEDTNVAVSYTFDIKVIDPGTGEELQPADGQEVEVSFALAEAADDNLESSVYHVTDEGGSMTAEKLETDVDAGAETVTATTEGFSLYTVEFTYNNLEYVMQGDTSVALSEILEKVGLTGAVEAVAVSDESLFSASNEGGEWRVTAHQAFSTTEWMKVTIGGITYEIIVTDEQTFRVKYPKIIPPCHLPKRRRRRSNPP